VPTDPERIAALRSDQPSIMREVEHGVTVDGRDPLGKEDLPLL
jgi:hypothetical protein